MAEWNFEEQVHKLAKTPLSERRRLARFAALFCEQAQTKPGDLTHALAPFLREQVVKPEPPDFEISVTISLVPGLEEGMEEGLEDLFPGELSSEDLKHLREVEPKMLEWLAGKDENAVSFVADPIAALSQSGLEIDPELLQRLKEMRERYMQEAPSPAFQISSLEIKVEP